MLYCLSTTDAPWAVIKCPATAVSIVLGRRAPADVVLDDSTVPMLVSRSHCRLQLLPDGCLEVEDLGSLNGTFVEGPLTDGQQRVQQLQPNVPHILQAGDTLLLGGRDTVMGLNKQMICNPFKFLVSAVCADAAAAGNAGHGAVAGARSTTGCAAGQAASGRQAATSAGQHHQDVHQVHPVQQQQQQQQQQPQSPCGLGARQSLAVSRGHPLHSLQQNRPTSTSQGQLVQRGILQASTLSNARQQHSSQHTMQQSAAAGISHQRLESSVSGVAERPAKRHRGASMPPVSKPDSWQLQRSATAMEASLSQPLPGRHSTAVAAAKAAGAAAPAAGQAAAGATAHAGTGERVRVLQAIAGADAVAADAAGEASTRQGSAACAGTDEVAAPAAAATAAADAPGDSGANAQPHRAAAGNVHEVERRRTTPQRAAAAAAARRAAAAYAATIDGDGPGSAQAVSPTKAAAVADTTTAAAILGDVVAQTSPPAAAAAAAAAAGASYDEAGTTAHAAAADAAAKAAAAQDTTPGVTPASVRLHRRTRPPSSGSKDMRKVRASNLECTICRELLVATHTLSCGHLFCGPCLAQWLELKAKPSCPTCRTAVESVPLRVYAIDAVVNEAVLSSGSEPQELAARLEAWDAIKADTTARWQDMFSSSSRAKKPKRPAAAAAVAAAAGGREDGRRAGAGGRGTGNQQPRQQQVVAQQPVQLQDGDRHLLSGLRHPAAAAAAVANDPVRGVPAATAAAAMAALAAAGTAAAPQVRRRQQGSRRGGRGGRTARQQQRQPARQQPPAPAAAAVVSAAGRQGVAAGRSAGAQQRLGHAAAGSSLPSGHSSNPARSLRQVAIDAMFR